LEEIATADLTQDAKPARTGTIDQLKGWATAYRTELLLFLLLWATYAYFYQSTHHNEAARFDQLRAIVDDQTLAINHYWWNSADVIHYNKDGSDHIYPNKAPGMTLLALIPFIVLSLSLSALRGLGLPPWTYWHLLTYLTTVFTVSLLSAVAAVAIYRVLKQLAGNSYLSVLAVLAVWLGTLVFPFSTLFFSHQLVAALLTIAFYLLFRLGHGEVASSRTRLFYIGLAGLLMSFSVATEYPAALLVGILSIYTLWVITRCTQPLKNRVVLLGTWTLGMLAGAGILILHNLVAFGKPFYIPYEAYSHVGSDFSSTYAKGWLGMHWLGPKEFLHALASITVYPQIGTLYIAAHGWRVYACNPVLWLSLPGLAIMIWQRRLRPEGLLVMAMTAVYILFITSYGTSNYDWCGASYLGSRHLIPLLPFLTLPLFFGARSLRFAFYPLLAISVFYMLIATATEPRVAIPYEIPARDLLIPDYLRARFGQNTDALFDGQRNLAKDSAAFNLGKLAGLPGHYQLTPLLLWWLIAGGALLIMTARQEQPSEQLELPLGDASERRRSKSFPKVAVTGLFVFVSAIALPPIIHHAAAAARHNQHGLLGKYYRTANWSGPTAEVTVDDEVNFDWSKSLPLPPPFSVEWTGSIAIEKQNTYAFGLIADDGAILEIDGKVVVDASQGPAMQKRAGLAVLSPGLHPIRIRYFNPLFGGLVKLSWTGPGGREEIVPNEVLVPPAPSASATP
jgi:PA14 domain-containing protein